MSKSTTLIEELIKAKIITDRLCDRKKAQMIIRQFFCDIHREAVDATIIAKNKSQFIYPNYND